MLGPCRPRLEPIRRRLRLAAGPPGAVVEYPLGARVDPLYLARGCDCRSHSLPVWVLVSLLVTGGVVSDIAFLTRTTLRSKRSRHLFHSILLFGL